MTAYMQALDNFFRMMQQLVLKMPLEWYDWHAAVLLAAAVLYQGTSLKRLERLHQIDGKELQVDTYVIPNEKLPFIIGMIFVLTAIFSISLSLAGGAEGKAYTLATLATGTSLIAL